MQQPELPFTIVMIEDDAGHAELIETNLREAGILGRLLHFTNSKEALEVLHQGMWEGASLYPGQVIVLLDLNLPQLDGHQVLKRLKELPRTHAIPVIILTTTQNPLEIGRCYRAGCNLYISKPVIYSDFQTTIRQLAHTLSIMAIPEIE